MQKLRYLLASALILSALPACNQSVPPTSSVPESTSQNERSHDLNPSNYSLEQFDKK